MQRRTITLPDDLGNEVDDLVRNGVVPSVSRFFRDAARRHLDELRVTQPARPSYPSSSRSAARPPWKRLR